MRPSVAAANPDLVLVEFPVALVVIPLLAWLGARPPRKVAPPAWRKHQQVVRRLPDPAIVKEREALHAWVESGRDPGAAARVIARATGRTEEQILPVLNEASTRKKRDVVVKRSLSGD